ncbi:MAG: Rieske 2Fe-2S domain-containing protein [Chloroflexota bacterium]
MAEFIEVLNRNEMKNGELKVISVRGKDILLARVDDVFYAASNACPHMKAKLSKGALKGTIVTCPRHASQFDLRDGHVIHWTNWTGFKLSISKLFRAPRPLTIYPVKIDGEKVMVRI